MRDHLYSENMNETAKTAIKRVVIVTETFAPEINGVANTLVFLVKELHKLDIEVKVVRPRQTPAETQPENELLVKGLPIPFYDALKFGLPCKRLISRLFSEFQPDVVYIATEGPLGYSALKAANKQGICAVSGFHTNFQLYLSYYKLGWLKPIASLYLKYFHNATQATFTPTEEMKGQLKRLGIHNARVMSRGIDTELFNPNRRCNALRESWSVKEEDIAVLYVGRLANEKNIDLAVKAYQTFAKKQANAKFVLVGNGPLYDTLKSKYPDFKLTGELRGEALAKHYASGDLFLFPSITDTFGNVVTEAMASGLCVAAFNYAAPGALVNDGLNGSIAPFGREDDYLNKINDLAEEPHIIAYHGAAARKKTEKLAWSQVVQTFVNDLTLIREEYEHDKYSKVTIEAPHKSPSSV